MIAMSARTWKYCEYEFPYMLALALLGVGLMNLVKKFADSA